MPNLIYTLDPAQIAVTNSFVENVMKLEAVGIPANNIIDIYLEAQKYAESIPPENDESHALHPGP